jgi:hypothetical protein
LVGLVGLNALVELVTGLELVAAGGGERKKGDQRHPVVPYLWVNYWRGDGGRSLAIAAAGRSRR